MRSDDTGLPHNSTLPRAPDARIGFGPFELDPARRILKLNGRPVPIRPRELDILICLVGRAGEFVPQHELIAQIWPNTTVSEANLRVQIAGLRRTLSDDSLSEVKGAGDRYIISASGRGYQFCARLHSIDEAPPPPPPRPTARPIRHNLPIRLKPAFGREAAVAKLLASLPRQRLVTIVGTGGIGKTTLALAVAENVVDQYDDGVRFINLAGLSNPMLVDSAIAATLDLPKASKGTEAELIQFVGEKQILFVLDNCEHVIDAVAQIVQHLLTRTPNAHFLCTSREPLHIDGEWLFRLGPLDTPPRASTPSSTEAVTYAAVRLFVERARLSDDRFRLLDEDADAVSELCRRLDGNPLAVELAAACVGLFGIQGLAAQLTNSFGLLTQGRRTALPRHQTLRATLDWSYDILSPAERQLLRRLAIFRGDFTLSSAAAVAMDADTGDEALVEGLAELSAKSLINVDTSRQPAHYRLLFLTRDYAFGKLSESGELQTIATAHAAHCLDLLLTSDSQAQAVNALTWIDDLRLAFEWAFSRDGDAILGMKLVCEAIVIGRRLSILNEFADLLDRALALFDATLDADPRLGVRLRVERLSIDLLGRQPLSQSQDLIDRAEVLARQAFDNRADPAGLFEVYLSKFARAFGAGDAPRMLATTEEVRALAAGCGFSDRVHITLDRVGAQAAHFAGDQATAGRLAHGIIALSDAEIAARPDIPGDRINPQITMYIIQARTLWLTGFPVQATTAAQQAVALAQGNWEHIVCYALAFATIPIALWRGDETVARDNLAILAAKAAEFSLDYWQIWADAYAGLLDVRLNRGSPASSDAWPDILSDHMATFRGADIADSSLRRAGQGLYDWCAPEIVRASAEASVKAGRMSADAAEDQLLRSLAMARRQGAVAWQLRTALSLATLWRDGRGVDGVALIDEALGQLSEGFDDADVVAANTLRRDLTDG